LKRQAYNKAAFWSRRATTEWKLTCVKTFLTNSEKLTF
jgi:hypothetical protein